MMRIILSVLLALCVVAPSPAQYRYKRYRWTRSPTPTPTPVPVVTPPPPAPLPPPPVVTPPPSFVPVADQIAADMLNLNEGHPHGVPSGPSGWDFANGPYVKMGNNPNGNRAAVLWGVIYADAQGTFSTNTRLNIRSCEIYWQQKSTQTWILGNKSDQPQIELYAEDYSSGPYPASTRSEPDGTISTITSAGRVAHFYPARVPFLTSDLNGWVAVCQMRLIVADTSRPDDRANAHFLGGVGADYYPALTGPGISNNPAIAGGRQKYISNQWRSFAMTTLSQAQLANNPPPIDLTGVLP